jgi:hypothetical protein
MTSLRHGRSWVAVAAASLCLLATPLAALGQGCLCGTAADAFVAERAGLVREWIVQLPFDSAGWRVEHVTVGDGLVVAVSGDGGVHAVSTAAMPETGGVGAGVLAWSTRIGKPGGPSLPAGIGPGVVAVARDIDLYALDRSTGRVRWQEQLGRLPGSAAAVIGDWVYAPLMNDGVRRTPSNPLRSVSTAAAPPADPKQKPGGKRGGKKTPERKPPTEKLVPLNIDAGGRVDRPPQAIGDAITWITREGILVALAANDTGWARLEYSLQSSPVGGAAVGSDSVFVATRAAGLARIRLDRAPAGLSAAWYTQLDAPPDAGPLLGNDTVVLSLGENGVAAYAAEDGRVLWRSATVGTPLAIAGNRVWILDRVGRLAGLDLATGSRREWLCLGCFTLPVVNATSQRLMLASPGGLLVSLAAAVPAAPVPKKPAAAAKPAEPAADGEPPAEEPAAEPTADAAADGDKPAMEEAADEPADDAN